MNENWIKVSKICFCSNFEQSHVRLVGIETNLTSSHQGGEGVENFRNYLTQLLDAPLRPYFQNIYSNITRELYGIIHCRNNSCYNGMYFCNLKNVKQVNVNNTKMEHFIISIHYLTAGYLVFLSFVK